MSTPFAIGRKWLCTPEGRARFYFVIVGPGETYGGKPSSSHKMCRLETHPDDMNLAGGRQHDGRLQTYSHKHIKKHAVLVPEESFLDKWTAVIDTMGRK